MLLLTYICLSTTAISFVLNQIFAQAACYKFKNVAIASYKDKFNSYINYQNGLDFYTCWHHCKNADDANFKYIGVSFLVATNSQQYGVNCFCSTTDLPSPASKLPDGPTSSNCNTKCEDYPNDKLNPKTIKCGNNQKKEYMSVYEGTGLNDRSSMKDVTDKRSCVKIPSTSLLNSQKFFFVMSHGLITPEMCGNLCYNAFGALVVGVQERFCYCSYAVPSSNASPTDCTEKCPGKVASTCGSTTKHISVYDYVPDVTNLSKEGTSTLSTTSPCYKLHSVDLVDAQRDKLDNGWNLWSWNINDPKGQCLDKCTDANLKDANNDKVFNYAAVSHGRLCWCSKGFGPTKSLPDSSVAFEKEPCNGAFIIDCLDKTTPAAECGGLFYLQQVV